MKRFIRVLVPLLLAAAVLGSLIWYLFVYDRDFTKDMLLAGARKCESSGYHQMAAWLYDRAYAQSGEVDDIAIELAEQYVSSGNYSKAEYTLSKAIATNPSAKLYAALCSLYVQQDKLMDAVAILDTISDPDIKAELDAQRPSVPTASPEPDFYSQYTDVVITGGEGVVYITTNGEYPSISGSVYEGTVSLGLGETVIYVLAVDENNLVSGLGVYGYTVGGIIEQVEFADEAMERAIRETLGVDEDAVVYTNDLWNIHEFTVPQDAQTYSDLSYLPYLQSLTVENGITQELFHIQSLSALVELHLIHCDPSEELLTAVAALPGLHTLTLRNCGLTSIAPLRSALDLKYLDLSDNILRNITPLSGMTGLLELDLSGNALTELTALSPLTQLQLLDISDNSVSSAEPICSITSLQQLDVSHNKMTTLGSIGNLTNLVSFNAAHNSLTDVSALAACVELQELDISNNTVADITMLSALDKLTRLDFAYNMVTALPAFSAECPLVTIDGSYNLLITVEELAGLPSLNNVLLDYNEELEDLSPLDSCYVLIQVNVYGTKVTEVDFLLDKSVIVHYNPVLEEE